MNTYANFAFRSHGQIRKYVKFAYMQNEICTWSRSGANFAYTQILHVSKNGKIAFTDLLT